MFFSMVFLRLNMNNIEQSYCFSGLQRLQPCFVGPEIGQIMSDWFLTGARGLAVRTRQTPSSFVSIC